MKYSVKITISLKHGMLDPEANAISHALQSLGFETESLSTAHQFDLKIEAKDEKDAESQAEKMCERLLANPVIHRYVIEVK